MEEQINNIQQSNSQFEVVRIDFQKWLGKVISYWWLFILSLGLFIGLGYLYLRYTTYQYSTKAILLIKDAGNSGVISEEAILLGQGFTGGGKSMDNEMQILRSLTLMEKVISKLGCNITYFRQGAVKEKEFYRTAPIQIDTFALSDRQRGSASFYIEMIDNSSFSLKGDPDDEDGEIHYYNKPFYSDYGYFRISAVAPELIVPGTYHIIIRPAIKVARNYQSGLRVERLGNIYSSSVLSLKLRDPVPRKAEDILNTLIEVYNEEEIRDENTILRNTLRFIDDRVALLANELNLVEGDIERFKSRNAITGETAAGSMSFATQEIRSAYQDISAFEVRKSLLASLESFMVQERASYELIPTNLNVDNPVLSSMVERFNEMVLERDRLIKTASAKNPTRQALESQMKDIRLLIIETIQNLQKDLDIPIKKLEDEVASLQQSLENIPVVEQKLLEQVRMQSIKEELFLFLLKKREETALSEAVTTASTRIVEPARSSGSPIYPKNRLVYIASTLLGLLIPLVIIGLLSLLETKVDSEEMLKQLTSLPILGRIMQNASNERVVVKSGDRSAINEMFRQLRTNLSYLNLSRKKQILSVTSFVPGEGKTFIAINLAITLSLSNKKVVLVELDLRRPRVKTYLEREGRDIGVSNYLIGKNNVDEIIQPFDGAPNLSIITCGAIPPNPSELILSEKMKQLLDELSERFDYILIDNPPIGLVSDALLLRNMVDNMLIVVRHRYTRKAMIRNLEDLNRNGELPNAALVFNAIKEGRGYYGYGGYRYGYGEGYYHESKK